MPAPADTPGASAPPRATSAPKRGTRAETAAGQWNRLPPSSESNDEQSLIDRLLSIGYLRGSRRPKASGVTLHRRESTEPGFNLYASGHAPEAVLMEMSGKELHRWRLPYADAFGPPVGPDANTEWWRRVHLFENGDLLAIFEGRGLVKLDKDSKLLWASPLQAHHDLDVQENGDIYVLTREARAIPRISEKAPTLEDFVTVFDASGGVKRSISLLEAFEGTRFRPYLRTGKRRQGDILHTNTVRVLDGRHGEQLPAFARGNVLTSMNALGTVVVVNPELGRVVWVFKMAPVGQHDPSVLEDGGILLFVNHEGSGRSEVLELDPLQQRKRWSYRGDESRPFYSEFLGAVQRLPNGNTLITESEGGRAFEITREGETVWEFYNPHRAGDDGKFIATLPEVVRLPADFPVGWAQTAP